MQSFSMGAAQSWHTSCVKLSQEVAAKGSSLFLLNLLAPVKNIKPCLYPRYILQHVLEAELEFTCADDGDGL